MRNSLSLDATRRAIVLCIDLNIDPVAWGRSFETRWAELRDGPEVSADVPVSPRGTVYFLRPFHDPGKVYGTRECNCTPNAHF